MELEKSIKQRKFGNEWHRLRVNLLFSSGWLANEIRDFLAPYDITQKQFNILRILRGCHPADLPIEEVRARMIDRMSDASRILDRLLRKGLIGKRPCAEDKRSNRVWITEEGLALLAGIDAAIAGLDAVTQRLTEEEARQLNALLDKMRGAGE